MSHDAPPPGLDPSSYIAGQLPGLISTIKDHIADDGKRFEASDKKQDSQHREVMDALEKTKKASEDLMTSHIAWCTKRDEVAAAEAKATIEQRDRVAAALKEDHRWKLERVLDLASKILVPLLLLYLATAHGPIVPTGG